MKKNWQKIILNIIEKKDFPRHPIRHRLGKSRDDLEKACWKLHELNDDIGSLMLADLIRSAGYSRIKKGVNVFEFYKKQYEIRFQRLVKRRHKTQLEYYFLGHQYATGAKIGKSMPMARKCFALAEMYGHPAARHEKIIATLIDDSLSLGEISAICLSPKGMTRIYSKSAISIWEKTNVLNHLETIDIAAVEVFFESRGKEIYSDYGKRYFNILAEKGLARYFDLIKNIDSNSSIYLTGLIAEGSRVNLTKNHCSKWYEMGALRGHVPCAMRWIKDVSGPESRASKLEKLIAIFGILPLQISQITDLHRYDGFEHDEEYD